VFKHNSKYIKGVIVILLISLMYMYFITYIFHDICGYSFERVVLYVCVHIYVAVRNMWWLQFL